MAEPQNTDAREANYSREIRFGVVMYGGVSLAIYINGVANELFELACATPGAGLPLATAAGTTRDVYRQLAWLIDNPSLVQPFLDFANNKPAAADPTLDARITANLRPIRFMVDVISGTSAGGINGIFLAKALANAQPFSPLKALWVKHGDIGTLLNDRRSLAELPKALSTSKPASLLNSERMYLKLLEAFQNMSKGDLRAQGIPQSATAASPLADEIDLFVTTTDIRGSLVNLRLFDKVVFEKRHRQNFHFQYEAAGEAGEPRNDFAAGSDAYLAFAARCTSSFPFAFEPMQWQDAVRLNALVSNSNGAAPAPTGAFSGAPAANDNNAGWRTRSYGDGGYLDNKPFSYVAEALSWRQAALPIDRKLIYVEPVPAHPELEDLRSPIKPNAVSNAVAALTSIPQYETIREDLAALLRRNRRIERVERIVRDVHADVEAERTDPFENVKLGADGSLRPWGSLYVKDMRDFYGDAYLPYQRLRVVSVNDDIADRLAERWSVDKESDRWYALRALVRNWRERRYTMNQPAAPDTLHRGSVNLFLSHYDVKYRLRRIGFLLRKTHQLSNALRWLQPTPGASADTNRLVDADRALLQRWQARPDSATLDLPRLQDALYQLQLGIAEAKRQLRRTAWLNPKKLGAPVEQARLIELGQVLDLVLGTNRTDEASYLMGVNGAAVKLGDMPPAMTVTPGALQEAVYARVNALFMLVNAGERTALQEALEHDLDQMRVQFAQNTGEKRAGLTMVALMGTPRLDVVDGKVQLVVDAAVSVDGPAQTLLNTPEGLVLRKFLAEYYLQFDRFDQASFPLYYDTGTGEPATVEVIRISPEDATGLIEQSAGSARQKLAGTQVFNFGGFLEAQWRRNDILWGRLDAFERMLTTLLPEQPDLRTALLQRGWLSILKEEMGAEVFAELCEQLKVALLAEQKSSIQSAFGSLWDKLGNTEADRRSRFMHALRATLTDTAMLEWVRESYNTRAEPNLPQAMSSAARAITITGRILEDIEREAIGAGNRRSVWLTRFGLAVQALLSVAAPGTLQSLVVRHWFIVLYLLCGAMYVASKLVGEPAISNAAFTLAALVAAIHAVTFMLRDFLYGKHFHAKAVAVAIVLAAVTLALAAIGISGLLQHGLSGWLCSAGSLGSPVCRGIAWLHGWWRG